MLEKLTPAQEKIMIEVKDSWLNKIFMPQPIDVPKLRSAISWLYKFCDQEDPELIICSSPMAMQCAANFGETKEELLANCHKISDEGEKGVWEVNADAITDINGPKKDLKYVGTSSYGNLSDYSWLAFYEFFHKIGLEIENDYFFDYKKILESNVNDMIQFDEVCICCGMPETIHIDENSKRMSCETGPAIAWDDGYELYYIDGMLLPKEYVMSKPEDLSSRLIFEEKNAERRHFLLQKMGTDRVLEDLESERMDFTSAFDLYQAHPIGKYYQHGDVLIKPDGDSGNIPLVSYTELTPDMKAAISRVNYELVNLKLDDDQYRPFLIMNNPSIEHKHIESVRTDCRTVFDAICWRNTMKCLPMKLT